MILQSFTVQLTPSDFLSLQVEPSSQLPICADYFSPLPSRRGFRYFRNCFWRRGRRQPAISNFQPLFWLGGFWLLMALVLPYFSARPHFASQKSVQEPAIFGSDDNIQVESSTALVRTDWSHVYKVVEDKSYFVLFLSKRTTHIIPKRVFNKLRQILDLRIKIRRHVTKQALTAG